MFENIPPQSSQPVNQPNIGPANSAPKPEGAVEDIFSKTESNSGQPPKIVSAPAGPSSALVKQGTEKKYFIVGAAVLIIILLAAGGWALNLFLKSKPAENNILENKNKTTQDQPAAPAEKENIITDADEKQATTTPEEEAGISDLEQPTAATTTITSSEPIDTDQDGLTDEEEIGLGTNPNLNDTDNDGLFDREEVRVYKTNPINPDTDGDGYKDGEEVEKGYNPNGAGKLYEIK
jgi:hypothetical protein